MKTIRIAKQSSALQKMLCLFLTLLSTQIAIAGVEIDDILYELNRENHTATVMGPRHYSACIDVVIPASITYVNEQYIVNRIGYRAFGEIGSLESISLPNTIEHIEYGAFYSCGKLKAIDLPENLISIGKYAFYWCNSLSYIKIPESVTYIESDAFRGCNNVKTLYVASTHSFDDSAFRSLKLESYWGGKCWEKDGFETITPKKVFWLPNTEPELKGTGVTYVSTSNVSTDDDLKRVDFLSSHFDGDNGVIYIPVSPQQRTAMAVDFDYAKNPETLTLPGMVTYKGIEMEVISAGKYCFSSIDNLKHLDVESALSEIPDGFVYNCQNLEDFVVDRYATKIGTYAFANCKSLADFTMLDWTTDVEVGSKAFLECGLKNIRLGRQLRYNPTEDDSPFANNSTLEKVWVTDIPTEIGEYLFKGCTKLNEVSVGDRILSINDYAFSGCTSISRFSFGRAVKSIGREAFSDCTGMKELYAEPIAPPICGTQALDDINRWECTLHVQEQSKETYAGAPQWKEFLFVDYGFGINLNVTNMYMQVGESFQLKVMKNSSSGNVTWKSTNESILTVSDNGLVTAVGSGAASIAVINSDGLMDNCFITVSDDSGVNELHTDETEQYPDMSAPFDVYNMNGLKVGSHIENLTPGIYIIRQGSLSKKIVVN